MDLGALVASKKDGSFHFDAARAPRPRDFAPASGEKTESIPATGISKVPSHGMKEDGDVAKNDKQPVSGSERDYVAEKLPADAELRILRARAIWLEVIKGVKSHPTALMERIDALLDPENISDATMLGEWRAKYANEITVRRKKSWFKRLFGKTHQKTICA